MATTPKKRIPQLQETLTPMSSGYTVYDDGQVTYKINLQTLTDYINTENQNTKFWLTNDEKIVKENETIIISGDYVLENTTLTLLSSNINITTGSLVFNKIAQIFIDGNLVLLNSNIINDGKITVGGATILLGNSTIIGTGIII